MHENNPLTRMVARSSDGKGKEVICTSSAHRPACLSESSCAPAAVGSDRQRRWTADAWICLNIHCIHMYTCMYKLKADGDHNYHALSQRKAWLLSLRWALLACWYEWAMRGARSPTTTPRCQNDRPSTPSGPACGIQSVCERGPL